MAFGGGRKLWLSYREGAPGSATGAGAFVYRVLTRVCAAERPRKERRAGVWLAFSVGSERRTRGPHKRERSSTFHWFRWAALGRHRPTCCSATPPAARWPPSRRKRAAAAAAAAAGETRWPIRWAQNRRRRCDATARHARITSVANRRHNRRGRRGTDRDTSGADRGATQTDRPGPLAGRVVKATEPEPSQNRAETARPRRPRSKAASRLTLSVPRQTRAKKSVPFVSRRNGSEPDRMGRGQVRCGPDGQRNKKPGKDKQWRRVMQMSRWLADGSSCVRSFLRRRLGAVDIVAYQFGRFGRNVALNYDGQQQQNGRHWRSDYRSVSTRPSIESLPLYLVSSQVKPGNTRYRYKIGFSALENSVKTRQQPRRPVSAGSTGFYRVLPGFSLSTIGTGRQSGSQRWKTR